MTRLFTCLHSSSNSDDVEELHGSSEDAEAQPYKTIFSEGLYFRRMVCGSVATRADKRGRRPFQGRVTTDAFRCRPSNRA